MTKAFGATGSFPFAETLRYFRLDLTSPDPERTKLLWLVRLRWLAILCLCLAFPFGVALGYVATPLAYVGIVSMLGVLNLLTQLFWSDPGRSARVPSVALQLALDLAGLCLLLLCAGGTANPFVGLLLLHVALGATLLDGRRHAAFQLLAHQALLLLQWRSPTMVNAFGPTNFLLETLPPHLLLLATGLSLRSLGQSLSRQQQLVEGLVQARERSDRLRALGALTAGFSHEFASPLTAAKIHLDRALRESASLELLEAREALLECEQALRQMNRSQLDVRDYPVQKTELVAASERIVESWRQRNSLEVSLAAPPRLETELSLLNYSQVLVNLLDNASEAGASRAELRLEERDGKIQLTAEDNGSGFPPDILKRLGEPFLSGKTGGTGLGLYSTQLFALSLGGQLTAANAEPGARLSLSWPHTKASL